MKSIIGTPKAQPFTHTIHRNLLPVENTRSVQIYLDLEQTRSPLVGKNKPKHLHLCSVHMLKTEILVVNMGNQRDADTQARRGVCGHDCDGKPVRLYVNAVNCGENSDVSVTKRSCRLLLCAKGPILSTFRTIQT